MTRAIVVLAISVAAFILILGAFIAANGGPLDSFSVTAGVWAGLGSSLAHSVAHRWYYGS